MKFAVAVFLNRYAKFCMVHAPQIDVEHEPESGLRKFLYYTKLRIALAMLQEAHRSVDYGNWLMKDDPFWDEYKRTKSR